MSMSFVGTDEAKFEIPGETWFRDGDPLTLTADGTSSAGGTKIARLVEQRHET